MDTNNTEFHGQVVISRKEYDELLSFKSDCEYLRFRISELQRMIFGSKSERFRPNKADDGQLYLFSGAQEMAADTKQEEETVKETVTYEREKAKRKPVRTRLPEHLRREEEVIEPGNIPEGAVKIGESVTEVLEYKPADVYVRVIIRPKYVLPGTEGEGCIVVAPMPSLPIVKGNAGAGILSHVCVSKFIDHLPFYRQAEIFKRQKIPVAESTLKGWYAAACRLLEPLYETLVHEIMGCGYLQADESPIPVLTSDKPGATHKGYMWVFHAPVEGLVCLLKQWLEEQRGQVLPKSPLGIAVSYTLNIWDRLERTMTDGRFEIDNNKIENKIRKLALGRKNYLFCGSHEGAWRNAMMYSFFACCSGAGVNPTEWMTDVLNRIPDHHANKLSELLPHNWKKNLP